ncbi:peptide ABC transporter substrate-binding protein [Actinopolymorpha sp. B17G11]|uniref:peptide ABC transporter substrate-binding protein n=1 Tax=unclassified Actinopolymorpha TaxID=2627063 RepID=UPI0032D9AA6D
MDKRAAMWVPPVGMSRREVLRISGLIGLATGAWSLTGCGLFDGGDVEGTDSPGKGGKDTSVLRISFVPVEVLDPQVITNGMWILTRGILEGLVTQNESGDDVVPAAATEWSVSPDNLTYTFQLRADAKWSNGDPVTAHDFERTYQRLFTPAGTSAGGTTLGANSYQASTGIKGAEEFLAGVLEDWSKVGVKATSDRELVLTLANPNPDFLLALTHPALLPLHMDSVEAKPDDWQNPPNFVSNGAYAVQKWTKNSSILLVPNTHYWDRGNVHLDQIDVKLVEPSATGTATVPYENDEVDILGISDADILRFQKDPELSKHLKSVSTYSIIYLAKLRSENPALDDVRVRKALSLGLGRESLAEVSPGLHPGLSLVTERTAGWDDSIAVQEDIDEAKRLLAEAGYPGGEGLPEIKVLAGVQTPMVEAIVDTWKRNLGIKARADVVEAGVYVERRWQVQKGDYIGFYYGSFAGLPTWPTMVGTLWSPKDVQMMSLPADVWQRYQKVLADTKLKPAQKTAQLNAILAEESTADSRRLADLVTQAKAADESTQLELFKQAAKLREEQYLFVPVVWADIFFAVRPTVTGVQLRPYPDFFYLKPLGLTGA